MPRYIDKLNYRQKLFIDYYTEGETMGNCIASMLKAGYKRGYAKKNGPKFLRVSKGLADAVLERTNKIKSESIATRAQRQAFWSKVANDPKVSMNNRLRASELLGKSEADFTENYRNKTIETPIEMTPEQEAKFKRLATIALNVRHGGDQGAVKAG